MYSNTDLNLYTQCHVHVYYYIQKSHFDSLVNDLPNSLKAFPKVLRYFQQNWTSIGHMWANFGRKFHHKDHETNNLVER